MRRIGFPQILYNAEGNGGGGSVPAPSSSSAPSSGASAASSSSPSAAPSGGDGGGSSPAPSAPSGAGPVPSTSSPGTGPIPTPSGFAPDAFDEFDQLDGNLEDFDTPVLSTEPQAPTPQLTIPPQQQVPPVAPQTPPVSAAQPPQQVVEGVSPTPPAQGPQEAMPQIPTSAEPGRVAELLTRDQAVLADYLASNEFQLSKEDLEALETDAPAHIPKLLARVYVRSQINMMNQLQRIVPAMVQRMTQVQTASAKNSDKFYARWPALSRDKHDSTVMRLAAQYRRENPQASLDQMIEELGPIAMMVAKVSPTAHAAPAGAPASNGVRPPPPSPFRPALSGGAAASHGPQSDDNPWMGLAGNNEDE